MTELVHYIDLTQVPHREGQSRDLEAKRVRAWDRLSDEEKEWVLNAWEHTSPIPRAPAFREMGNATDRVLYVLVGTEESLTPNELCYLMIARWFRNIDPATARAKMALLVRQGLARYTGVGRTIATEPGLSYLEELARPKRRGRDEEDEPRRRSKTDDSFGNYGAPSGRFRHEIDAEDESQR